VPEEPSGKSTLTTTIELLSSNNFAKVGIASWSIRLLDLNIVHSGVLKK